MYITIIFQAAERASEGDKIAKGFNLKILERKLTNIYMYLRKIFTIWNVNNSPAFALTAWKCLSFTR